MKVMNKTILIVNVLLMTFLLWTASMKAQEAFYELTPVSILEAPEAKDLRLNAACWSNAGTLFLESELQRLGKDKVVLSELAFVYSAYMKKATIYLKSDDDFSVDPSGLSFDVISLAAENGMVPDGEYLFPDDEMLGSREKEGEMNAIVRGTLKMVKQNEGGQFTERWQNMYSTSLLRYIGEPKRSFTFQQQMLTPMTFMENLGLNLDDYVLVTSHPVNRNYSKMKIETESNWSGHEAFNVSTGDLSAIISAAIAGGYSVLWYGAVKDAHVFGEENMAIVPLGKMPGQSPGEIADSVAYEPIPEKVISNELRLESYNKNLETDQTYLLLHGVKEDQNENQYFTGKYACVSGSETLNLSRPFIALNTVFLMVNKNSIPEEIKKKLKL
jgi:bleomycin hydrolase